MKLAEAGGGRLFLGNPQAGEMARTTETARAVDNSWLELKTGVLMGALSVWPSTLAELNLDPLSRFLKGAQVPHNFN